MSDTRPVAIAYVGNVVPDTPRYRTKAFSRSGNLFQSNLLDALVAAGARPYAVTYEAELLWPRGGRFFVRSDRLPVGSNLTARSVAFLNVILVKQLWIGLAIALRLLAWSLTEARGHERVVYSYNLTVPPASLLWLGAKLARARWVVSINDVNIPGETLPSTFLTRFDYAQHRFWLPKTDAAVAVTPAIIRDFIPNHRFMIMEGGLAPEFLDGAYRRPQDLPERPFIVTLAGALQSYNGVLLTLECMSLLGEENVILQVAGDGPLRPDVIAATEKSPNIRYLGFLPFDQATRVYATSHLLLNVRVTGDIRTPYFFPGKLIDYLASGTPVLSTNCSHVAEEYGSLYFPLTTETPAALAAEIKRIAHLPRHEREVVGERARLFMLENKEWKKQGQKLKKFLAAAASG